MAGRGRNDISQSAQWPGRRRALEALKALRETERLAGATLVEVDLVRNGSPHGRSTARDVVGFVVGLGASGSRAAGYLAGGDLVRVQPELQTAARNQLPVLMHYACAQGGAAGASHDAFVALRDSGCFMIFGADAQEAVDLALIGHRIAEQTLTPGVCAQDAFSGQQELFTLLSHEAEFVGLFLGRPGSLVPSPTASQRLLFGNERRRVPCLIDVNRPLGVGVELDTPASTKAFAAQGTFFADDFFGMATGVFDEFTSATGRDYAPVSAYLADDADYLVVAMGYVTGRLKSVVDDLRHHRKKVGLLTVRMYRPFPGSALSNMIRGKKGVTVLESVSGTFGQDPPLLADIRAALDRATENGLERNSPLPHPEYAAMVGRADRPVLYSALAGSLISVTRDDLRAVYDNMIPGGAGTRSYHVGVQFGVPTVRVPGLERLGQLLEAAYEGLHLRGLKGRSRTSEAEGVGKSARILGLVDQDIGTVGATIAKALFSAVGGTVESHRLADATNSLEGGSSLVFHSSELRTRRPITEVVDIVAAARSQMLNDDQLLRSVRAGGTLVVSTRGTAEELWNRFPSRVRAAIQEQDLVLFRLPATEIARDISSDGWIQDQLVAQILAASVIPFFESHAASQSGAIANEYRRFLKDGWLAGDLLLDRFLQAFDRGLTSASNVDWKALSQLDREPDTEPEAPWTVRDAPVHDETVFDAGRFWNAVGYLYQTGRPEETLTDPYVASGLLPARTAAFRSWTPYRSEVPVFLPENCTACGTCFVSCPEAAMPVTVAAVAELLDVAMNRAEEAGTSLLQLRRLQNHLAAQAHRLVVGDDRHEYRTLGELLNGGFERLVSRLEQTEDEASRLKSEFDVVAEGVRTYPVARTPVFFENAESSEKGTGLLFSVNINPDACKACGICATECAEGALEMKQQTQDLLQDYSRDWDFAMELPVVSRDRIDTFVTNDNPVSVGYRLLDRRAYHSVVGGDSALPGSGTRATLHLIAAMADSIVRPKTELFEKALSELVSQLQGAIRDHVTRTVEINDFEEFGRRLRAIDGDQVDPAELSRLAGSDQPVDHERLVQLNTTLAELEGLRQRYDSATTGDLRASMVAAFSLAGSDVNSSRYPYNPYSFPWINVPSGDAVAVAEGLLEGAASVALDGIRMLRKAKLILDDVYDPAARDGLLDELDFDQLSDEEWGLCPPVCIVARSEEEIFPHLLETSVPVKVFVLNGTSPVATKSATLRLWPLVLPDMYVLRSTIGLPGHLLPGLKAGLESRRAAVFHLHVCEPSSDGVLPDRAVNSMRAAVESRAFPVLAYDPDKSGEWADRWDLSGNPSIEDYWPVQTVETSLAGLPTKRNTPFTLADWAVRQGKFRNHFRHVPRNAWSSQMLPLTEFLELAPDERDGKEPYVEIVDVQGHVGRAGVEPAMVVATEASLRSWMLLQELAGIRSSVAHRISTRLSEEFEIEIGRLREELRADFAQKATAERQSFESEVHLRLTQELLALSAYGPGTERAHTRLAEFAAGRGSDDGDE